MKTEKSRPWEEGGSPDKTAGHEFRGSVPSMSTPGQASAYDRFVTALERDGRKVTHKGHSSSVAQCPAHEDSRPSLSVKGIEGQALIYCHAGCSSENVLGSLGLNLRDLFDDPKGATYRYTDASGKPGRIVYRTPEKNFPQSGDMSRVELYRLPRVVEAVKAGGVVYLVEGEKDVHALESLGITATTAPMGADNFSKVDVSPLRGARVVAVVDRDAAGLRWAQDVRTRLDGYASALEFVEARAGKDAADHVAAGYGVADFAPADVPATQAPAAGGWDEPEPLESRVQLPDFPTNCLPPVVARYVDELCRSLQVPPGLAGTVALGVLSAASAGRVRVQVRPDWAEPTSLWVVPVADPASKKSAVVAACRAPLDAAEGKLRDLLGSKVIESRTEREIREQNAVKLKKVAAEDPSALNLVEAQSAARLAEEVKVLAMPRLTVGDSTPEALVSLIAEQGGRIAAISAEAGVFTDLTGRHSPSANLDPILKAHAGDMIQVDRKGRGPERVENPALTLIASIQPYALRKMVAKEDFAGRGLLARVLWSLPPNMAGTRTFDVESVSATTKDGYTALVENLAYGMFRREETATLGLSPEAYKLLGAFHDEVERQLAPGGELGDGEVKAWAGKLLGATARIAGVLHAAAGESALGAPIPGETMRDAVELARYFRAHAVEALGQSEDTRTTVARTLCEWLVKDGKATFTVRRIQQSGPRSLRKTGAANISAILGHLAVLGYVRQGDGKGWELNPDAAKYLNPATPATTATPSPSGRESAGQGAIAAVAGPGYTPATPWLQPGYTPPGDGTCSQVLPGVATGGYSREDAVTRENVTPVATVATVARVDGVADAAGVAGVATRSGMEDWNSKILARHNAVNSSAPATVPEPRRPMTVVEPNPFDFDGLDCSGCGWPEGSPGCRANCGDRAPQKVI